MNATVTMKEEVRKDSLVREIPLDKIHESSTNPHSHFDERALAELAANLMLTSQVYCSNPMRRSRSWKRGSERRLSSMGSALMKAIWWSARS